MTLQQLLLILRARYKVAVFTLLITVLTTLVISLLLPKQYTASTAVVVDVRSPDPVAGIVLPGLASPAYMATQVDIINNDRVAQTAVKLLRMDESAVLREQWIDATGGTGDFNAWLADLLKKKLDVKPSRESNVINIEFSGADPNFAAGVANAFAQAYIAVNRDLKLAPARQSAAWFEDQTRAVREKLEKAQAALSAHQQKTGVVATDERLDYETAKLNELSSRLTNAQAETTDSSSKYKSAGSETLAEVMQSPLVNTLKSDIARLEAKFQESNVNLGENHPQTKRTQSELASLRRRLASETRQISDSIGTSFEVGKQKEKELLEAMEIQKNRVLELNRERDGVAVLMRDVEAAQRTFEAVSQRAAQTNLESQSVPTSVAILNPATVPTQHSRPRVLLNVLISIFLGTLLGIGIALMLELVRRRIRSAEDLIQAIDLPVLAVIPGSGVRKVPRLPKLPKLPKQLGSTTS